MENFYFRYQFSINNPDIAQKETHGNCQPQHSFYFQEKHGEFNLVLKTIGRGGDGGGKKEEEENGHLNPIRNIINY